MASLRQIKSLSRKYPYPYNADIGGVLVRLGEREQGSGLVVNVSPAPESSQTVRPTDLSNNPYAPTIEQVAEWRDFSLGMGAPEQLDSPDKDKRYYYTNRGDASTGEFQKMSAVTIYTPTTRDTTYGFTHFAEFNGEWYAGGGKYLCKWNGTDWNTLVKDFSTGGAGVPGAVLTDMAAIWYNDSNQYLFCLFGDTRVMGRLGGGGAWADAVGGTAPVEYGKAIQVAEGVIWIADGNTAANIAANVPPKTYKYNANADPFAAASTAAAYVVGDRNFRTGRLELDASDQLLILKQDGIFLMPPGGGNAAPLFPTLVQFPHSENGKTAGYLEDKLYTQYGEGFYRFGADLIIEPIGIDQLTRNNIVQGRVTAFAPHSTFFAYVGIWDPVNTVSYLMKFGAWAPNATVSESQSNTAQHLDAWHGYLWSMDNVKINALVKSKYGPNSTTEDNPGMWMGLSDGTIGFFRLSNVPNPAIITDFPFTASAAFVFLPRFFGTFRDTEERLHRITIEGYTAPNTSNQTGSITVYYRTTAGGSWTFLTFLEVAEAGSIASIDFPTSLAPNEWVEFQIVLDTGGGTGHPILTGFTLHYSNNIPNKAIYELYPIAATGQLLRNRARDPRHGAEIAAALEAVLDGSGSFNLQVAEMDTVRVRPLNWRKQKVWDELANQWQDGYVVQLVEL